MVIGMGHRTIPFFRKKSVVSSLRLSLYVCMYDVRHSLHTSWFIEHAMESYDVSPQMQHSLISPLGMTE